MTFVWRNVFALYAAGNCDSLLRENALVIVTHSGNAFYVSITCILEVAIIKRHFAVLGAKNTIMLYTFKNRLYWKFRSVICRLPPEPSIHTVNDQKQEPKFHVVHESTYILAESVTKTAWLKLFRMYFFLKFYLFWENPSQILRKRLGTRSWVTLFL